MATTSEVQENQYPDKPNAVETEPEPAVVAEVQAAPGVRERILREATRLFSTKGFNGISVREIVEAAGITKPTLYYYFANKETLFERIIAESLEEFRQVVEGVLRQPAETVRERLTRIAQAHFEFARERAEHTRLTYSVYFSTERNLVKFDLDAYFTRHTELIRDILAEGIARGEVAPGDPWLMALGYIGILNLFIMSVVYNPAAVPAGGLAEIVADLALNGLAARKSEENGESQ